MKRTIALALSAVSLGVASLALATPAQATSRDCQIYLVEMGYVVGPKAQAACDWAAQRNDGYGCLDRLVQIGVRFRIAGDACSLGARK